MHDLSASMRILHVTDFHFNQRWFDWLAVHGREYDAVCFTGDLVTMFTRPQRGISDAKPSSLTRMMAPSRVSNLRDQARWVRDWLKSWSTTTPLFLCSGNHDYWPQKEHYTDTDAEGGWLRKTRRPGNVWVDENASTLLGGHRFVCTPWARSPRAGTIEPTVALVHAPPAGTEISSGFGNEAGGDADVAQAAHDLPPRSFLLCGHIHNPRRWYAQLPTRSSGERIWAFNPGFGPLDAAMPNFIVLDTIARRAEFHGTGAVGEEVELV